MNSTTTSNQRLRAAGGVASGLWSADAAAAPAEYRHAAVLPVHRMPITFAVKRTHGITRRPSEAST